MAGSKQASYDQSFFIVKNSVNFSLVFFFFVLSFHIACVCRTCNFVFFFHIIFFCSLFSIFMMMKKVREKTQTLCKPLITSYYHSVLFEKHMKVYASCNSFRQNEICLMSIIFLVSLSLSFYCVMEEHEQAMKKIQQTNQ